MINVAVIGCGYWGPNLIRNFATCPATRLVAVCDRDEGRLQRITAEYPSVVGYSDLTSLLEHPGLQAVAIATPVSTHGRIGLAALEAGMHVLMEKPLANSVEEAELLVRCAREANLTLMVDHIFVHSGPVRKMKALLDAGELGQLYFIDGVRINLGLIQHDINVIWDLAPHDLSMVDFFVGRLPESVSAVGSSHTPNEKQLQDVAYLTLDFGSNLLASFHVNWLSPVKIRQFILCGSKKSVVYNDLDPAEKVKVYDRGFHIRAGTEARQAFMVDYRVGDVWSPQLDRTEPLQTVVTHFADCIQHGKQPLTNGEAGLRIVRILEAAERSIRERGTRIPLQTKVDNLDIRTTPQLTYGGQGR